MSETERLHWQKETETAKANEQIKPHTQANTHRQRHTKAHTGTTEHSSDFALSLKSETIFLDTL